MYLSVTFLNTTFIENENKKIDFRLLDLIMQWIDDYVLALECFDSLLQIIIIIIDR